MATIIEEEDLVSDSSGAEAAVRRRIVDADAHIEPPHEMWREYLPERFRDRAPYIEEGEEHDWIVFEGKKRPLTLISNTVGRDKKTFKLKGKLSDARKVWVPEQRLADMDQDGMDAAVLFGGGPLGTDDIELYMESYSAYNRWLWDFCGADRRRLVPVAYLPMRDVDETVKMVREVSDMGFRSINIPAFPQSADPLVSAARVKSIRAGQGTALTGDPSTDQNYCDAEFDKFWAEVSHRDMTVTMHLGGRLPRFGEKRHFLPDLLMSKFAMAEPVAIMIFGGLFQRYPKLRVATIESGVGWLAFAAEYMDRTWEKQRYLVESPLKEQPSFFMDQNIYASFINDRAGIVGRNLPGASNIMWSSDYPHSETTFPHSLAVIKRDFAGIPEEDIREIICERASRVFSVPG